MPFIISIISALQTLIGSFIILHVKTYKNLIPCMLSLAGSVMLCIALIDLLPNAFIYGYTYFNYKTIGIIIMYTLSGIIIAYLINKIFDRINNVLYKIGTISLIAMILHNIPEGMATYLASSYDLKLGLSLALSIGMHNIPEGFSIALPIYYGTNSKKKAYFYTFLSGISELMGTFIAFFIQKYVIGEALLAILFSLTVGIMSYVAIIDLIKSAFKYKCKKQIIISLITGLILTLIVIFLL